ncbi:UDP-glucose:undecaprenyl-phosphate glucose-1-phosphate transferase [compost metagenome]
MHLPISFERDFERSDRFISVWRSVVKRLIDILFSLTIILFLFPVTIPLIALCIYIDSGGPIFFIQKRVGHRKQVFNCLKFRTMKRYLDQEGQLVLQVTRVGAILRNSGLDELPQLFNVLIGDMSVVGPRPYSIEDDETFGKQVAYFNRRYRVRPGITGLAQAEGYKGWIKNEEEIRERTTIDLMYVNASSLRSDVKIIFRSIIFLITELFKSLWKH